LPKHAQSAIDMREYLTVCCRNLGDALREVRPIAVNVSVSQIYLRSEEAVAAVGLIVNELVTNAFKYAFPDDRGGTVNVMPHDKDASELELVVEDNGKGCPEDVKRRIRLSHRAASRSTSGICCFASYRAPELLSTYRQAASYVDRILRGEKPADLPVQAPTKYGIESRSRCAQAQ
jgi:anti-sigma regulatory factor (Ser/Thr protein kinase)